MADYDDFVLEFARIRAHLRIMSWFRYKLVALAALAWSTPALADTAPLPETLRFFNDCAGRVAAHISVHGWNDPQSVTRAHLDSIIAIVAAFPAETYGADLAARQSAARAAHAALLQHAMTHGDLAALDRARAHIDRCRDSVLAP